MKTYQEYIEKIRKTENDKIQKQKDEYHKTHKHVEWNLKKDINPPCGCSYFGSYYVRSEQSLLTEVLITGLKDFLKEFTKYEN